MPISFTFPHDVAGLAGAIRSIRQGADYVIPILDLGALPRLQTNAPLAASGVFTGVWQDRMDDALTTRLRAWSLADQAGTLFLDTSPDQTTVTTIATVGAVANVMADTGWTNLGTARWYRFRYVNGGTSQSTFIMYAGYEVARGDESQPIRAVLTDRSGTITTGGASQQLMPSNPSRRWVFVENLSSGALYLNFSNAATLGQPSVLVPNGQVSGNPFIMDRLVSSEVINIFGATAGQAFAAKEA